MKLAFAHGLIFHKGTKQKVALEKDKDFKYIHPDLHPKTTNFCLMISIPINCIQLILIGNKITLYIYSIDALNKIAAIAPIANPIVLRYYVNFGFTPYLNSYY